MARSPPDRDIAEPLEDGGLGRLNHTIAEVAERLCVMVGFRLAFPMAEPAAQESIAQYQPGVAEEHHVGAPVARFDEPEIQPARFQCVDEARPLAPCQHAIYLHAQIHIRVDGVGDVVEGRRTEEGSSDHG
jgi:hypothetical protein